MFVKYFKLIRRQKKEQELVPRTERLTLLLTLQHTRERFIAFRINKFQSRFTL